MKYPVAINRRLFLKQATATSLGLAASPWLFSVNHSRKGGLYDGLASDRYLGKVATETRIEDEIVFTEGPAVDRAGAVYFTNVPVSKILKWDPEERRLTEYTTSSNRANGLRFAQNGEILVCEGGSGKVVGIDIKTGNKRVLADRFGGKGLQSPNDLDFDSAGRIYFSSRAGNPDPAKENARAVYRIDPDGSIHQLLAEPDIDMPNGIVVSPDEQTLYLIESHGGENRNRSILAFDLDANGSLSNRRTLIDFYPGRSGDGMCVDAQGNLYVAAGLHKERGSSETLDTRPGIHMLSRDGRPLAFRETPEDTITNCTFGGYDLRTLYVTCGTYLLSMRTRFPGKKSYRPSA